MSVSSDGFFWAGQIPQRQLDLLSGKHSPGYQHSEELNGESRHQNTFIHPTSIVYQAGTLPPNVPHPPNTETLYFAFLKSKSLVFAENGEEHLGISGF